MNKKVCWSITTRCNKNCIYCFKFNKKELPVEDNLRILDSLVKKGIKNISWTGGEPYLYDDIDILLKKSHEYGIYNSIYTNASKLDISNLEKN